MYRSMAVTRLTRMALFGELDAGTRLILHYIGDVSAKHRLGRLSIQTPSNFTPRSDKLPLHHF